MKSDLIWWCEQMKSWEALETLKPVDTSVDVFPIQKIDPSWPNVLEERHELDNTDPYFTPVFQEEHFISFRNSIAEKMWIADWFAAALRVALSYRAWESFGRITDALLRFGADDDENHSANQEIMEWAAASKDKIRAQLSIFALVKDS